MRVAYNELLRADEIARDNHSVVVPIVRSNWGNYVVGRNIGGPGVWVDGSLSRISRCVIRARRQN